MRLSTPALLALVTLIACNDPPYSWETRGQSKGGAAGDGGDAQTPNGQGGATGANRGGAGAGGDVDSTGGVEPGGAPSDGGANAGGTPTAEGGVPAGTGGVPPSSCEHGDTRVCIGPGACEGGQLCGADGWGECDCGPGEGTGGATGTGGSPAVNCPIAACGDGTCTATLGSTCARCKVGTFACAGGLSGYYASDGSEFPCEETASTGLDCTSASQAVTAHCCATSGTGGASGTGGRAGSGGVSGGCLRELWRIDHASNPPDDPASAGLGSAGVAVASLETACATVSSSVFANGFQGSETFSVPPCWVNTGASLMLRSRTVITYPVSGSTDSSTPNKPIGQLATAKQLELRLLVRSLSWGDRPTGHFAKIDLTWSIFGCP